MAVKFLALVGKIVLSSFLQFRLVQTGSVLGRLTACKACSETEGSELRLSARNGLHDEAVGVFEVDAVHLSEKIWEELEVATADLLQTLASLNRKSLISACCAEVCFITCSVDKPFVDNPYPELDNQYSRRSCGSVDRFHFFWYLASPHWIKMKFPKHILI